MNNIDWQQVGLKLVQEITTYLRKRINESGSTTIHKMERERNPIYVIDEEVEDLAQEFLIRKQIPVVLMSEDRQALNVTSAPQKAFILDPLDGSMNAARGIPFYCVSLAIGSLSLTSKFSLDDIDIGIVQNVCSLDTFIARKGQGSYLNGNRIATSRISEVQQALVSTYIRHAPPSVLDLANAALSIRTTGSAALELCEVARGIYESFVDLRGSLKIFDIAAGAFIIKEAGGVINVIQKSNIDKEQFYLVSIIASGNEKLHKSIIIILDKKK